MSPNSGTQPQPDSPDHTIPSTDPIHNPYYDPNKPLCQIHLPGFDDHSTETQIEMVKVGACAYFDNRFQETIDLINSIHVPGTTYILSVGMCYMKFVNALFTMEKDLVKQCVDQCRVTCDELDMKRKGSSRLSGWLFKTNYSKFTDEEVLIECFYGEVSFMLMIMGLIDDPSYMALIRGAFKLRNVYNCYFLADEVNKSDKQWRNHLTKGTFDGCYRLGWGMLNLICSHMPRKVLSLMSMIGFTTRVDIGIDLCKELTLNHKECLSYRVGCFFFCFYSFYAETFLSLGSTDLEWVKQITSYNLMLSPRSAFETFWGSRTLQLEGNPDAAIQMFTYCKSVQSEFKQIDNICNWDILWSYALKQDWDAAAKVALELAQKCNWSKATNMFQHACFLYMKMEDSNDPDMKEDIRKAMEMVPRLKKRMAGKSIPPEKYAITVANQYLGGDEDLGIPIMDLFYIWNIFSNCAGKVEWIQPMMTRCDNKIRIYSKLGDEKYYNIIFMKGVCLRLLGRFEEAIDLFQEVIDHEEVIIKQTHIPPHAAFEMGLSYMSMGNYVRSKDWFHHARDDYSGFLIETQVQIRIHTSLQKLAKLQKE